MAQTDETKFALMGKDIEFIRKDIAEIKQGVKDMTGIFATQVALDAFKEEFQNFRKTEFSLVQKLVFGLIALIVTAVIITILLNVGLRIK